MAKHSESTRFISKTAVNKEVLGQEMVKNMNEKHPLCFLDITNSQKRAQSVCVCVLYSVMERQSSSKPSSDITYTVISSVCVCVCMCVYVRMRERERGALIPDKAGSAGWVGGGERS